MSATVAEGMTNDVYNPNTELIGHGIANMGAGLLGGIPVTGAIARTTANINGGAKSPLAGISHALFLLVMYFTLMPIFAYIPFAVLAAVLIKVAITMSRFPLFLRFITFGIRDSLLLTASLLLTVFLGVAYGVLLGIALAFLINIQNFIHNMKIEQADFEQIESGKKFKSESKIAYKISGAVFFMSVNKLIVLVRSAILTHDEIVLDFSGVSRVDATAVERLAKLAKNVSAQDKRLVLHNLSDRQKLRYEKAFKYIIVKWKL
jgi:SulP family sulfate permease